MTPFELLHGHPKHRSRQLRWVLPLLALLVLAVAVTLAVQYAVSGRQVQAEFFRAHKTISNTAQLLWRGTLLGGAALLVAALAIALWALRTTHRIVRPVHTLHRALDALAAGDLGVRVALHGGDEFHEVGDSLNRLVDEFAGTLARVHALSDEVVALTERLASHPDDAEARARLHAGVRELDAALEFFRLAPRRTLRDGEA
jgi:methyl-accepting chemotaxis protein